MQSSFKTEYETIINASIAEVWQALTDPNLVKQYFFGTDLVTDWKVKQPIVFTGSWDGVSYIDKGMVIEYVHDTYLSYSYLSSWSEKEDIPENHLIITYAVEAVADGTKLTITQTNYDEEKATHAFETWASVIDGMKILLDQK